MNILTENNRIYIYSSEERRDKIIFVLISRHVSQSRVFENQRSLTNITGSKLERGLAEWDTSSAVEIEEDNEVEYEEDESVYEIVGISKYLKDIKWLKYIPILPNFDPSVLDCNCCTCCGRCKKAKL